MFWALSDTSLRHAFRRLSHRVQSAPISVLVAISGLMAAVVFGPSAGAGFGAAQAELVALDPRPLTITLIALAFAGGALSEPAARSMRWRQPIVLTAPCPTWTKSLSAIAPLAAAALVILGSTVPTMHAAVVHMGQSSHTTLVVYLAMTAAAALGAASISVTRSLVRGRWALAALGALVVAAAIAAPALISGGRLDAIRVFSNALRLGPAWWTVPYLAIATAAAVAVWARSSDLAPRRGHPRSIGLPSQVSLALIASNLASTTRRPEIRGHVLIGTIATVVVAFATGRLLDLPAAFTSTLGLPLVAMTAFGPGLAAGAATIETRWLYATAPHEAPTYRLATVTTAALLGVVTATVMTVILGLATGSIAPMLGQLPAAAAAVAGGVAIAARLNPWTTRQPSAPITGMLVAGVGCVALNIAIQRLIPLTGLTATELAAPIALATVAIAALLPDRNPR